MGAEPVGPVGVPTEQLVPDTEKSAATTLARVSEDVTSNVSTEELLGLSGAPSASEGGPRSISKDVDE